MEILYKIFKIFIYILLFNYTEANITVSIDESKTVTINNCILQATQSDLINRPQVVIYKSEHGSTMDNDLLNTFTINIIPLIIIEELEYINEIEENTLVIMNFINCSYFKLFKAVYFKENIKYFIILTNETNNCDEEINENDKYLCTFDVAVIINDSKDNPRFLSFLQHVDQNTCKFISRIKPVQINTCINGNLETEFYLPRKTLTDMKNCTIKAGITRMYPLSIIENEKSLSNYDILENPIGSDVELIKIIAKTINAGVTFYYMQRSENIPYLDRSYTKFMLNGSLDVCAGGLYRDSINVVAYSGAYEQQGVVWVYTVDRMEHTWSHIIEKMQGLYLFFIFYVCYSVVWNILLYFDSQALNWSKTFLYSWGILFGASSLQDARNFKQKLLNIVYLVMCIYFSILVGVQLYSFLTIQEPPKILRTIEDVYQSGRTPYLNDGGKHLIKDEKFVTFVNTSKDCLPFNNCVEKVLEYKGLAIVTDSAFIPLQLETIVNNEARLLKITEAIVHVNHEMIIRKNRLIVGIFQKRLNILFEAGICKKLFLDNMGILAMAKRKKAIYNIMHNSFSCRLGCSITLTKYSGLFYLWMLSCFISCCVFVLEILLRHILE